MFTTMPNGIRSMDFLHDACENGCRTRILAILDNFTRTSPRLLVRSSRAAVWIQFFRVHAASLSFEFLRRVMPLRAIQFCPTSAPSLSGSRRSSRLFVPS